jgi:hypothetical protein
MRLEVDLGVVAADAKLDVHRSAQYVRGFGWNFVMVTGR